MPTQLQTTFESEGQLGSNQDLTLKQEGEIPTSTLTLLPGQKPVAEYAKEPGWDEYVRQVATRGVSEPISIVVGWKPGTATNALSLQEGDRALKAALETGLKTVPVDIYYLGRADEYVQFYPSGGLVRYPPKQKAAQVVCGGAVYALAGRDAMYRVENKDLDYYQEDFPEEMDATDEAVTMAEEYPGEVFTVYEENDPIVNISYALSDGELRYELF